VTTRRLALFGILACAATGCQDPYRDSSTPAQPIPHRAAMPGSAADTARAFATRWINWNWETLPRQQRALARLAGDRLATRLRADADAAAQNASLARDKPANRGKVAAVSVNQGPRSARGLVVTLERAYSDGHLDLGGARYRVYRVAITATRDRWKVTGWAPQP
jgi:hypothetical protein